MSASPFSTPIIFVSSFMSGREGAIYAYGFDLRCGKLIFLHQTADFDNPFFLAISPNGKFLYVIDAEQFGGEYHEFVAAYSITRRDGKLVKLNRQSSLGTASCYLDVDPTGRCVVVANYLTGSLAALPVRTDGTLGQACSFVQHCGSSVNPERQKGPHAHSVVVSPDNRFVLAADLGIDKVLIYRFIPDLSKLVANEVQAFAELPPGSGPRHLAFHHNGRHVYVINELTNTITFFDFAIDAGMLSQKQTISTLPDDFHGINHTADLKITPDGRFLYGTNRGHDSIAIFHINDDGLMGLVSIEPSLGNGPQNLLISHDGSWLICANMLSNSLIVFAIDSSTGRLKPVGDPVSIPMPSCIRLLEQ